MTTTKLPVILFDASHNEELVLDEPELSQLVELLEANGMKSCTMKTPLSVEELTKHRVVVIGNPLNSSFNLGEITALISFVESGGGLLLVSGATIFGKGGDAARNTNLNDIAKHFRFRFAAKALGQPTEDQDELITAVPARDHPTLSKITKLFLTSGVSLVSEDTKTHLFRVNNIIGTPTVAIATEVKKGRIVAFGGGTFFFNDYLNMGDHERLLVQVFRWLSGGPMNRPVQKPPTSQPILDEVSATEAIADLRAQLDKIEGELSNLKEVINTSVKEIEKLVRQFQDEDKEP
jgi:uncharacterized membrane protein